MSRPDRGTGTTPEDAAALTAEIERLRARVADLEGMLGDGSVVARGARLPSRLAGLAVGLPGDAAKAIAAAREPRFDARAERWRRGFSAPALLRTFAAETRRRFAGAGVGYRIRQRLPTVPGRRARVLHAITNLHVGGSTQLVVDIVDHLGHRYAMSALTASPGPHGPPVGLPTHVHRLPGNAAELTRLFARLAPDLLHVHYWGMGDRPWYDAVFAAAETCGIPVLQNVNTPVPAHESHTVRYDVYVSESARDHSPGRAVPGTIVNPGIDLGPFAPPDSPAPEAADTIGMVYRLAPDKLDAASIRPFIEVVKRRPRTRAIIIGDGALRAEFEGQVAAAGLTNNFVFAGTVPYDTLPAHYARFSVFVAPVWQESFGQVVPFAMAMGLAVAGNRIGALPDILEGDETLGTSVEDTAERILALLDDPARRAAIGARNRAIALRRFGIDPMIDAYAAIYRDLLGDAGETMPGFPPATLFDRA
jgi:glycosyltransferase involved in cell wall biosynthesis